MISFLAAASSQAETKFDLNAVGSPVQAGWTAAELGTGSDGTVSIATVGLDGATVTLDSRDRAAWVGGGSEQAMWQDFLFANGSFASATGTGLRITISGLEANTNYAMTLWAYDASSGQQADGFNRAADWEAGGDVGRLDFNGAVPPTSLDDYRVIVIGESDASGVIVLTGLVSTMDPSTSHNVFLNGLEVSDPLFDVDADGLPDSFEQLIVDADDMDGIASINDVLPGDDFDDDASSNQEEYNRLTDPIDDDSDDDGAKDGWEDNGGVWVSATQTGTDPLIADTDGDGIPDGTENHDLAYDPNNPTTQPGTDPNLKDTDGDNYDDDVELADGTDPTDPESFFDPHANVTAKFDFNAPGSPDFDDWTGAEAGNGTNGTVTVVTEAIGAVTVDTRDRIDRNTNGPGADLSRNDLWRDFVFANGSLGTAPGTGLRVTLSGLLPSTTYPITIWAFDDDSNNGRRADWGVPGEETGVLSFPTSPDPSSLLDYRVDFEASTDGGGVLVLEGLVAEVDPEGPSHNVFVNALVVGLPTGSTKVDISLLEYDPENLLVALTWNSRPGKIYIVQGSDDLENWDEVDDNVEGVPGVDSTRFEFDATYGDKAFYRVVEAPSF
ncbi:hypothetical protein N9A86_00175 [Akkermansiaceae bacterium]|nr:hypothetical protein [Akkermansiaceae bacterium]MDB4536986.1 hypothetical protein [Akkermansiaceae bacterium]